MSGPVRGSAGETGALSYVQDSKPRLGAAPTPSVLVVGLVHNFPPEMSRKGVEEVTAAGGAGGRPQDCLPEGFPFPFESDELHLGRIGLVADLEDVSGVGVEVSPPPPQARAWSRARPCPSSAP